MTTEERENRFEALSFAVRHRLREEKSEQIVRTAQIYLKFLENANKPSA